jgi:hypothetical protein
MEILIEILTAILALGVSLVFALLVAIGPLAILFAKFGLPALRRRYLRPSADRIPGCTALVSMFVSSCVFALWMVCLIFRVRSSTAAIWFLAVPIYSLGIGTIFYLVTWALSVLFVCATAMDQRKARPKALHIIASVTVLLGAAVILSGYAYSAFLASKAANPSASQEELERLFRHHWARYDRFVMAALARNDKCPPGVLFELARRDTAEFRERHSTFRDLIRNDFRSVLEHVASNPTTPPEALEVLANSPALFVVREVARNPHTPKSVLVELSRRDDLVILSALAGNPSTPAEILGRLSRHQDISIRSAVAFNPSTPGDVLQKLASDANRNVSIPAKDNLKKKTSDLRGHL